MTASNDDYQIENTWDSAGNRLSEKQGYAASGQEKWKTVSKSFDSAGSTTLITYPSGFLVGHARDAIGRLKTMVDNLASVDIASFTWQGVGRLQTALNQNGTSTDYAYDGFARTATIDHVLAGGTGSLHRMDYAYDKAHNRRMEKNTYDATWLATLPANVQAFVAPRNGKGDVYAYDWAYRLSNARYDVTNPATEVSNPGSQTYAKLVTYTLDGLGNRSQVQTTVVPGVPVTVSYSTDVVNQYTAVGGVSRTHDNNGNLSDDGTRIFRYDFANRITEAKLKATNTTIATYRFDPLGRRVEKAVAGGATTRFVYGGQHVLEEYDGNDVLQAKYTFEDGIDVPRTMDRADIADVDGDTNTTEVLRFAYHQSALQSVTELSAPSGAVVEWTTYDVYGKATISNQQGAAVATSAIGNRFQYTGREWDVEVGHYHYRARAYDQTTGRFLQRDPAGYVGSLSGYEYTQSSPSSASDPSGFAPSRIIADIRFDPYTTAIGQHQIEMYERTLDPDYEEPSNCFAQDDPRGMPTDKMWFELVWEVQHYINVTKDECGRTRIFQNHGIYLVGVILHIDMGIEGFLFYSQNEGSLLSMIRSTSSGEGSEVTVGGVLADIGVGLGHGAIAAMAGIGDLLLNLFTLGTQYAATGEWFPCVNGVGKAFSEAYTPQNPILYLTATIVGDVATGSLFAVGLTAGTTASVLGDGVKLVRSGAGTQSIEGMAKQLAKAEAMTGEHSLSSFVSNSRGGIDRILNARPNGTRQYAAAYESTVERLTNAGFKLGKPSRTGHVDIHIPKPLTRGTYDKFIKLWDKVP